MSRKRSLIILPAIFFLVGRCKSTIYGEDFHEVQKENPSTRVRANGFWDPLGLPKRFDAREKWTKCPSIGHIHDQGNCRSSYALAVASAVTDRICIHSNGTETPKISPQQILSCCYLCGDGCNGGKAQEAWFFYQRHGLVTGGSYNSGEGCQPYTIEPCRHEENAVENSCASKKSFTPDCKTSCYNYAYRAGYRKDNHKGRYYKVQAYQAMREIYDNGPITASFYMYYDFVNYKSGVYKYNDTISARFAGVQAVKILGWGEESGVPYWLAANSFNADWGENGFVKILRGANECYIEEFMYAGLPLRV